MNTETSTSESPTGHTLIMGRHEHNPDHYKKKDVLVRATTDASMEWTKEGRIRQGKLYMATLHEYRSMSRFFELVPLDHPDAKTAQSLSEPVPKSLQGEYGPKMNVLQVAQCLGLPENRIVELVLGETLAAENVAPNWALKKVYLILRDSVAEYERKNQPQL